MSGEFTTLTLASGDLEATFVPDAGMVGCSLRHRGEAPLDDADLLIKVASLLAHRGNIDCLQGGCYVSK